MVGPREQESRLIRPPAHRVVSCAIRAADHYRYGRHSGVRHRVDQLCAVSDDALLLVSSPDHEARDVLQKDQWNVLLIAELNELRALAGGFGHQHAVVCEYPD